MEPTILSYGNYAVHLQKCLVAVKDVPLHALDLQHPLKALTLRRTSKKQLTDS